MGMCVGASASQSLARRLQCERCCARTGSAEAGGAGGQQARSRAERLFDKTTEDTVQAADKGSATARRFLVLKLAQRRKRSPRFAGCDSFLCAFGTLEKIAGSQVGNPEPFAHRRLVVQWVWFMWERQFVQPHTMQHGHVRTDPYWREPLWALLDLVDY